MLFTRALIREWCTNFSTAWYPTDARALSHLMKLDSLSHTFPLPIEASSIAIPANEGVALSDGRR